MSSDEEIKLLLHARRAELEAELDRLARPPEEGANVSFGKRIGDGTTEAVERVSTTAVAKSLQVSMGEIDRALAKLAEGTYGHCDKCGDVIPPERVEAKPAAVRCVGCSRP